MKANVREQLAAATGATGRFLRKNGGQLLLSLLFVAAPFLCFWEVELLSENDILSLADWQWAMNLAWYSCILFLGLLITGRRKGAIAFSGVLSFAMGLVNHYVLEFRGRALFPIDLLSLKTAANVAGNYDYTPDEAVWRGLAVLGAMLLALLFLPRQKKRFAGKRWAKWVNLGVACGWLVYLWLFFGTSMLSDLGIHAQQWKTQGNGFLLNFTVSIRYMRVDQPEGYSEEAVLELIARLEEEGYTSDSASDAEAVTNFILIMDESFADLTVYDSLTLSGDPTPYLHSLTENTIKGYMIASVTGGGTAATEFEVLTGNTMAYLPGGTVAYQMFLTETTASLAQTAAVLGARTSAYHPYESSGWNRTTAYARLGFANQYYLDLVIGAGDFTTEYSDDELIRSYVSDSADFARISVLTETANALGLSSFVFNVTMQNHSGYAQGWNNLEKGVTLTGDFSGNGYDNSTAQYLALVTATDNALQELIDYYSSVEEPTVIVFFGDHQPPLKNALFEAIYGKALDDRTGEELIEQYKTPFFIWANFDIPEEEDLVVGASFLGTLAAKVAGYPRTGYQKFLETVNETFSAITPVGYVLADGTVVQEWEELTEAQQTLARQYEWLQYYNLFGSDAAEDFFFITE